MSDWILSIEGTEFGARLALYLALLAAFMHAAFGALQKGRHDPWLARGAIDFCYMMIAAPFVLFILPWPEPHMWPIFAGMMVIHLIYKYVQGKAYSFGAFTVVYPVVRGLGPVITVIGAGLVFGESFAAVQWLGVLALSLAILALGYVNYSQSSGLDQAQLGRALFWAALGGVMVAVYTVYDAWGIRASSDPLSFLAWFFFLDGLVMPFVAYRLWVKQGRVEKIGPLMARGLLGGVIAYFSFGAIMIATRIDTVGEAAVLRETSPVFAALIGFVFLKESVGRKRLLLICAIAFGAVLVEFGGA